eukprot:g542.t1
MAMGTNCFQTTDRKWDAWQWQEQWDAQCWEMAQQARWQAAAWQYQANSAYYTALLGHSAGLRGIESFQGSGTSCSSTAWWTADASSSFLEFGQPLLDEPGCQKQISDLSCAW